MIIWKLKIELAENWGVEGGSIQLGFNELRLLHYNRNHFTEPQSNLISIKLSGCVERI